MSVGRFSGIQYLDHCIHDLEGLRQLRKLLEKVDKICGAVEGQHDLADIFQDSANRKSLLSAFGPGEYRTGVQLLLKLALSDWEIRSFLLHAPIAGQKKFEFLFRSVAAWRQFRTVLVFQLPESTGAENIVLVNPLKVFHWKALAEIPAGTLITIYVRGAQAKRSASQERLAAERYEAILDLLQSQPDAPAEPAPVIQMDRHAKRTQQPTISSLSNSHHLTSGPPSFSFRVVVSKTDIFVHAGNAQLILTHVRQYQGAIQLFVLRGKKQRVQLDSDSIWAAEMRNGETVLFEFYGPKPSEEFVKELAKKVNKYTQMDKLANE